MSSWDVGNVNVGYEGMYTDDVTRDEYQDPPSETPRTELSPEFKTVAGILFIIVAAVFLI